MLYELLRTCTLDNSVDVSPTPIRSYISFAPRLYSFIASACIYIFTCVCIPTYTETRDKCTHVAVQRADIHYGLESPRNDRLANVTTVSQRITK